MASSKKKQTNSTSTTPIIVGAVVVVLLALIGALFLLLNPGDAEAGEIFLAPAATAGPDPYSETPFAQPPDPSLAQPATETSTPVPAAPSGAVTAKSGGQPGLYGGTRDYAACDAPQMVSFLGANPDKANAWVSALNEDGAIQLADGSALTAASIGAYVATLTPIVLREDTRVTNHGYRNGRPTRLQAVLQKGTAVLVDTYGVPRVKCYCGNPLLPPVASRQTPVYTGPRWPDFNPAQVNVIQPSPTPVQTFQIVDLKSGGQLIVPVGMSSTPTSPGASQMAAVPPAPQVGVPQAAAPLPNSTFPPSSQQATPQQPAPQQPAPPSNQQRCSPSGGGSPVSVLVTNFSNDPVEIVWYDYNCTAQAYRTLGSNDSYDQQTTTGHVWVALNPRTGAVVSTFTAGASGDWTIN